MKPNTTAKLSTIAKLLAKENPQVFQEMCEKSEPMLKNLSLIPRINSTIKSEYPDMDRTDESIMFAACCYHAYAPATIVGSGLDRAPNGLRKQMCEVMQWVDAPLVNYYQSMAQAYFKGKTFREKVDRVLSFFQGHSVKKNQIQLF